MLGANTYGQLGDGTTVYRRTPVDVSGLTSGVKAVAAGWEHACALTSEGSVKCWGANWGGALGDGTGTARHIPVDVSEFEKGIKAIAAGGFHSCALTSVGGVKCWGGNVRGALGGGTSTDRMKPVDVMGLTSGVMAMAAGDYHTRVVTMLGEVKCWGINEHGELGIGAITNHEPPLYVMGMKSGAIFIAAGGYSTCALTSAEGAKCWGNNQSGQLGDGITIKHSMPVDVVGLNSGVTAIAIGPNHACALTSSGKFKCWGNNANGQLGDGTTTERLTPVDVKFP